LRAKVERGEIVPFDSTISAGAQKLLSDILNVDPAQRISLGEFLKAVVALDYDLAPGADVAAIRAHHNRHLAVGDEFRGENVKLRAELKAFKERQAQKEGERCRSIIPIFRVKAETLPMGSIEDYKLPAMRILSDRSALWERNRASKKNWRARPS
jgi:hypothetical protein